jgi:hypothetical protein
MAKELEIEISETGQVTVRPKGIKGKECIHWAELLAQIVGKEEARQFTSEYYEAQQETQAHQNLKQRR